MLLTVTTLSPCPINLQAQVPSTTDEVNLKRVESITCSGLLSVT